MCLFASTTAFCLTLKFTLKPAVVQDEEDCGPGEECDTRFRVRRSCPRSFTSDELGLLYDVEYWKYMGSCTVTAVIILWIKTTATGIILVVFS